MKTSHIGYFQSLAEELRSQSLRVRQLIGDAHWGHDGRHKEVLLQNLIRRHCPPTVVVSTGFIVSSNNAEVRSKEQDLLIVDVSTEAPLFQQGGLVITFPHSVVAAISIKSTLDDNTMTSVVDGLVSVRNTACDSNIEPSRIWCGGFFYKMEPEWEAVPAEVYRSLKKHILANPARKPVVGSGCPHILGPDVVAEATDFSYLLDYELSPEGNTAKIRGYNCKGAATAVFLSCLIEHLSLHFQSGHSVFSDMVSDLSMPAIDPPISSLLA